MQVGRAKLKDYSGIICNFVLSAFLSLSLFPFLHQMRMLKDLI